MNTPNFTNNYNGTYDVSATCSCGRVTTAVIQGSDLFKYNQGAFAQVAFPYLTSDEREALFISGVCAHCWDRLCPPDYS